MDVVIILRLCSRFNRWISELQLREDYTGVIIREITLPWTNVFSSKFTPDGLSVDPPPRKLLVNATFASVERTTLAYTPVACKLPSFSVNYSSMRRN